MSFPPRTLGRTGLTVGPVGLVGAGLATPYWRVVRDDGSLVDKFPGGVRAQAARLIAEGPSD